jgi:molybdopterin/thiamine biosynthesis adenylyltransferase
MFGRILVAGVGGLGTWTAELWSVLASAWCDWPMTTTADLTNIHRQSLYDESDADTSKSKV